MKKKKIVCTKQSDMWVFATQYLEMISNVSVIYDQEFLRLYKQLMDYAYSKIELPDGEFIESYHIVKQEINE